MNKKLKLEIGKNFGKWEIISHKTIRKNNLTHWLCRCECGTEEYIPLNNLMNGSSTQCRNCATKQSGKKRRKGHELISGDYWAQIKFQAKRKQLPFEIRIEQAWKKFEEQKGRCFISNKEIILTGYPYNKKETTAILSLIIPHIGYVIDNIIWIHKDIAKLKGELSYKELLNIVYEIEKYNRYSNHKRAGQLAKQYKVPVGILGCPNCGAEHHGGIFSEICTFCGENMFKNHEK